MAAPWSFGYGSRDPFEAAQAKISNKYSEIDSAMHAVNTTKTAHELLGSLDHTPRVTTIVKLVKELQKENIMKIAELNKDMGKLVDDFSNVELDGSSGRKDDGQLWECNGSCWGGEKSMDLHEDCDDDSAMSGSDESDTDVAPYDEIAETELELDDMIKGHKQLCATDRELRMEQAGSSKGKKPPRKLAKQRKQIEQQKRQMRLDIKQVREKLNKLEKSKKDKAEQDSKRSQKARKIVTPSATEDYGGVFSDDMLNERVLSGFDLGGWVPARSSKSSYAGGWSNGKRDATKW